ncbi:MAG: TetR family transcriptional regulator [Rhizobiaceae bacterium]
MSETENSPRSRNDGNAHRARRVGWTQDPSAVREDILDIATQVFAEHGLAGARVDEIVRRTKTSKRMIYYYFGDKDGLYLKVLEAAYARVRAGEDALNLEELDPTDALVRLVEFTFDFHRENPHFVRLVAIENIHNAEFMARSERILKVNSPAIGKLRDICQKGIEAGQFRADLDPVELHWLISSSCVFNVSNRDTFEHLFGSQLFTKSGQDRLKALVVRSVCNSVLLA